MLTVWHLNVVYIQYVDCLCSKFFPKGGPRHLLSLSTTLPVFLKTWLLVSGQKYFLTQTNLIFKSQEQSIFMARGKLTLPLTTGVTWAHRKRRSVEMSAEILVHAIHPQGMLTTTQHPQHCLYGFGPNSRLWSSSLKLAYRGKRLYGTSQKQHWRETGKRCKDNHVSSFHTQHTALEKDMAATVNPSTQRLKEVTQQLLAYSNSVKTFDDVATFPLSQVQRI